jgi:hypothetical protein
MDAEFASTTHSQISQSEAFLSLGLFDKTNFTNSSQKWTIIYVQVVTSTLSILQVNLQMHLSVLISVLFV